MLMARVAYGHRARTADKPDRKRLHRSRWRSRHWRRGNQVMAPCKLGRPAMGATARFRGVAAKTPHYPTRI